MLLSTGVVAESTVYVGDKVKIPMRSDDVIAKNNIIDHLNINTPLTLIKKQANGWSHIKHEGKEGFMISRYLVDKEPVNYLANKLQEKVDSLHKTSRNKSKEIDDLTRQIETLKTEISRLNIEILNNNSQSLEFNKLQNKLLNLDKTNTDLETQVAILKSANSSLHTTDFLTIISAITLFLGFGISAAMSRASSNRDRKIYKL
jgi:SH3 domain protein